MWSDLSSHYRGLRCEEVNPAAQSRIRKDVQLGAITKSGNAHLRRVLVESTWTYRHRPNVQGRLLRRQKSLALPDEAVRIAWKAQQRLYKRFTALSARGKNNNVIVTALAPELLGFMWAIAVHTEAQRQPIKAA